MCDTLKNRYVSKWIKKDYRDKKKQVDDRID